MAPAGAVGGACSEGVPPPGTALTFTQRLAALRPKVAGQEVQALFASHVRQSEGQAAAAVAAPCGTREGGTDVGGHSGNAAHSSLNAGVPELE